MINHAVQFKQWLFAVHKMITKSLCNIFLVIKQICRATLAGFSENNGVVYAKYHKSIIHITVLYELIKGITVLYMSNQVHYYTVWLIQYSYAVDYYVMNYTAHFFALIHPCKLQYTCKQCWYM